MIGIRFIFRVVLFLVAVLVAAGIAVGVYYALTFIFRYTWELFERQHKAQAAWLKSKLPKVHWPWRKPHTFIDITKAVEGMSDKEI
jgi:hypothetical protein